MPSKKRSIDIRNLEDETIANDSYRRVVYTVPQQFQLVLMSLNAGEKIECETHSNTVQFFRIEKGVATVTIGGAKYSVSDGGSLTIPPNTLHCVENAEKRKKLKLYTIYTPPEHPPTRHQQREPKSKK